MTELYSSSSRATRGMRFLLAIACFASTAAAGCRDFDDDCTRCFLQEHKSLGKTSCAFCVAFSTSDEHGVVRPEPLKRTRCTPVSDRSTVCPTPPWTVLTEHSAGVDELLKANLEERARMKISTHVEKRDPLLKSGRLKSLDGDHYTTERVGIVIVVPGSSRSMLVHLSYGNQKFWLNAYERYLANSRHPRPFSQAEFLGTVFVECSKASGGQHDARDLMVDLRHSIQHDPNVRRFWTKKRKRNAKSVIFMTTKQNKNLKSNTGHNKEKEIKWRKQDR